MATMILNLRHELNYGILKWHNINYHKVTYYKKIKLIQDNHFFSWWPLILILGSNFDFSINLKTKERIMTIIFYQKELWIFYPNTHLFFLTHFLMDDFSTFLLILYYTIFSFRILFMKITTKNSINEQRITHGNNYKKSRL